MADEKSLINDVMLFFTSNGHRVFRQNTGFGWIGSKFIKPAMATSVRITPNDVLIPNARPFHAGLCKGSSDLIGWKTVVITPNMVGQKVAVFTALECKTPNYKASEDQQRFITNVNNAGGYGKIVYSLDDVL